MAKEVMKFSDSHKKHRRIHTSPTSLHGVYVTIQTWLWFNWIKRQCVGVWGLGKKECVGGWQERVCVCVLVYIDRKSDFQVPCVYKCTQGSVCFCVCGGVHVCVCLCGTCGCIYMWAWGYSNLKPWSGLRGKWHRRQVKMSLKLEWGIAFFLHRHGKVYISTKKVEGRNYTVRAAVSLRKSKDKLQLWLLYISYSSH